MYANNAFQDDKVQAALRTRFYFDDAAAYVLNTELISELQQVQLDRLVFYRKGFLPDWIAGSLPLLQLLASPLIQGFS